jgi:hypothetical protein
MQVKKKRTDKMQTKGEPGRHKAMTAAQKRLSKLVPGIHWMCVACILITVLALILFFSRRERTLFKSTSEDWISGRKTLLE